MPLRTTPTSFIEKGSKAAVSERQNEASGYIKNLFHKDDQTIFSEGTAGRRLEVGEQGRRVNRQIKRKRRWLQWGNRVPSTLKPEVEGKASARVTAA